MRECAIALGSNQGDRLGHLAAAVAFLRSLAADGRVEVSDVYETDPVGCEPGAGPFLNAAVVLRSALRPGPLLERLRAFERDRGRAADAPKNISRPLDLDLLFLGDEVAQGPELILPHPRLGERAFVLKPLADLRPERRVPGSNQTVAQRLAALPDHPVPRRIPADPRMRGDRRKMEPTDVAGFKGSERRPLSVTGYDYPTARLLDEAGVEMIHVGDTLGMVVLGHPDTTSVTMADMLHHVRAVARAKPGALITADLPIHSYDTADAALSNARRLMEAGADAVKMEGGRAIAAQLRAVREAGIPVQGHIGMLPQQILEEGGYKRKGRTDRQRARLVADAALLSELGCFSIVLECVVADLAREITRKTPCVTLGIGCGTGNCDGEIRVLHDVVGLFPWFVPPFIDRTFESLGERMVGAVQALRDSIQGSKPIPY